MIRIRGGVDLAGRIFDFRGCAPDPIYDPVSRKFVAPAFMAQFGDGEAGGMFGLVIEIDYALRPMLCAHTGEMIGPDLDLGEAFVLWLRDIRLCDASAARR